MENNENKTPVTEESKVENATPVTEEVKTETAPEVVSTTTEQSETKTEEKKEKKPKKSLFAKEKKPWEQENQREPLDKKDYLCICGFIILVIIAFLPYFLRFLDTSYDDTKKFSLKPDDSNKESEQPKSYKKLMCNKTGTAEGYSYSIDIVNTYENGNVKTNDITYNIVEITDATLTNDTVVIDEYKTISEIASSGIQTTHENGTAVYKITINYATDENLRNNNNLSGHFKAFGLQKGDYEEQGFTCRDEKTEG